MAAVATNNVVHSYSETSDANKSVFDLGAFVGDLTVEEDASSDDISLEGLEQELEECKNDDVVANILSKGTTLREYTKGVENNLRQVELDSIQDYITESDNLVSLHDQIRDCDSILSQMETLLSGFQDEIGSISSDIKILQEKSMDMGLKLKNRKVAESKLAKFVEDIIVPPRMIDIIVDGEVNDEYMRTLEILSKKLKFVEVDLMVKTSKALKDVQPELERLRQKAVSKVFDFIIQKLYALRKPKTNIQILQQSVLLKYKYIISFLKEHDKEVYTEVRAAYIDTMNKMASNEDGNNIEGIIVSNSHECHSEPPTKKSRVECSTSRTKSEIWNHFTKSEDTSKASCNYCKKTYAAQSKKNGTSTMWHHLKEQCRKSPLRVQVKNQATLFFEPKKEGQGGSLKVVALNQEELRKALVRMIIMDELPFKFVEGEGFKKFVEVLQPRFTIPSRFTIARDCLRLFEAEKMNLKKMLRSNRVCLTTDTWTSIQNLNFMCLTAHWIDCDWILHKRILNFCQVSNHKGETIGKVIQSCLLEWGIENFLTITVDNASSNNGAIKYLKSKTKNWKGTIMQHEFLHLRCCAHIINLIVKEGLKNIDDSIVKIRNAVRYVRSSPSRTQAFKMCIETAQINSKSLLCLDVETRWNSTYLMLEAAEKFEAAFEQLEEEDNQYLIYFQKGEEEDKDGDCGDDEEHNESMSMRGRVNKYIGPPTRVDWTKARSCMKFLKLFLNATLKFSSSLQVTSNTFFKEMVFLQNRIMQMKKNEDYTLSSMAYRMITKFDKYWDNLQSMNFLLYVAIVLDPRYKLRYVEFCFSNMYEKSKAKERMEKVESILTRLFEHYNDNSESCGLNSSLSGSNLSTSIMGVDEFDDDFLDSQFEKHLQEKQSGENKSELERYLEEPIDIVDKRKEDFDVLAWWKLKSSNYPIVSQIARDVFAIPISTVSSESAFSTGGRVIDPFRSGLSPKMIEALICTQNWLQCKTTFFNLREALEEVEKYEEILKECPNVSSTTSIQ